MQTTVVLIVVVACEHGTPTNACIWPIVFHTAQCNIEGDKDSQQWYLDHADGRLVQGLQCAALGRENTLITKHCTDMKNDPIFWEQVHMRLPIETELYLREKKQRPEIWKKPDGYKDRATGACAQSLVGCFAVRPRYKGTCLDQFLAWNPEPQSCQEFYYVPGKPAGAIRANRPKEDSDPCLDRLDENNEGSYGLVPCAEVQTQDYYMVKRSGVIWFCDNDDPGDTDECLSKTRLGAAMLAGQP